MNALTQLWRSTALHRRLPEFLETSFPLIEAELGAEKILAYRLDTRGSSLELVAHAGGAHRPPATIRLGETQLVELAVACRASAPVPKALAESLLRASPTRRVLTLAGEAEACGVLVLELAAGQPLARPWEERLTEIFAAALRSHQDIHRLVTEREAAESNRASLLRKLGRDGADQPLIGAQSGLLQVMERVKLVAPTDLPVLLLGETGSGKEVVARGVHDGSPRRDAAFVRVNCGAISPGLIDSELFGHERGSFTGADAAKKGWFERADGGTLFLDEIGEMPESVQVRLLRILQDGTFERVGAEAPRKVDVRIIAATHRDLGVMAKEGRFRQDLWFRIASFPIPIPPLRERPEDIPSLAAFFAERAARRFGIRPSAIDAGQTELLLRYAWPGNVRELASVIDRAVLLGQGNGIDVTRALGMQSAPSMPAAPPAVPSQDVRSLDSTMRAHIEKILGAAHGRVEGPFGAAALLGINPHTLRSKMRRLGIEARRFRLSPKLRAASE